MKIYTEQDAEQAVYAIYLRKSRADLEAEARGEGETLARHEKILMNVAAEQNLKIGRVFKEIVSGETIQDRPKMKELLKEINTGKYAGVLVVAADRLSRGDFRDMGHIINALKFSNTLLVTPNKTYDVSNKIDEQFLEMLLFQSKQEFRAITARLQDSRLLSVMEGNYISGVIPLGYDLDTPDKWTRTLKPNEDADLVRKIFDMRLNENLSYGRIANALTLEGIKPKRSHEWSLETIREILNNPVYIGKIRWRRVPLQKELAEDGSIIRRHRHNEKPMLIEGKHSAIISLEVWDAVHAKKKSRKAPIHMETELKNPLAGLLVCAKCKRAIRYHYVGYTEPKYYHKENSVCKISGTNVAQVIDLLAGILNKHIEDFTFKIDNTDKMDEAKKHSEQIKQLEKDLKDAQRKRNKLFDDFDDNLYTKAEFAERKAVWADRISKITSLLDDLRNTIPEEIDYIEKVVKFSQVVEHLRNPEVSAQAKNDFLKEIIDCIEIDAVGKGKNLRITLDLHLAD